MMSPPPWASLPPHLAVVLRPELGELAEEVIAAIARDVDDYRRPLEGDFGRNIRRGVEFALGRFLDLFGDTGERDSRRNRQVYVELGRGEFGEGRSLDALLSAYRVGARVSWRRFVQAGRAAGVDPDVLFILGEAMFAYIDGLSAESTEGYADAQATAAGERARALRRLVRALLNADHDAARQAARQTGWELPATLAAIAAQTEDADALASRLGADVIAAIDENLTIAIVSDPDAPRRRGQLEGALTGTLAALGPTVPWTDAAHSAARARLGLTLHLPPAEGIIVTADHLPALLLQTDPRLADDLAATALAPLKSLSTSQRTKLTATLRAWLDHHGRVEETARALAIHPQTVRYRVNQLRELLDLDDTENRFTLQMALRCADGSLAARS